MYKIVSTLSNEALQTFDSLITEVEFSNSNIRLGANGLNQLSKYSSSRWYDWTADQRSLFKRHFGPDSDKALVGWFLKLPAEVGFLDLMTYWEDKIMAGNIVAYSLSDNQKIRLANEEITVNRGNGIKFSLKIPHEIKKANIHQTWVCIMNLDKE